MNRRKRYLLIGIAIVIVALLAYSFRPTPVAVSTAVVGRGPLQVTVEQEGRTRVRERYVISAPVAGYAPRLDLEVGDKVAAGQTVLSLQPAPSAPLDPRARAQAEARLSQARANLKANRAQLDAAKAAERLARDEFDRNRRLREKGQVSASAFEQARAAAQQAAATLHAARFAVAAAEGEVAAAGALLQYVGAGGQGEVAVKSPVAGDVLAIAHKSAGVVNAGEPLLTVGNPRALEVEIDVLSADAVRIRPGMRVEFQRWGGPTLEGRVRVVQPAAFTKVSALGVEEQRVWIIADITSPPDQWRTLGDAYRVEARFILWQGSDVLRVPTSALFRKGEQWAVFVVKRDHAVLRTVKIGHEGELEAQVLDGLKAGEEVITHPDTAISDGTPIERRAGDS